MGLRDKEFLLLSCAYIACGRTYWHSKIVATNKLKIISIFCSGFVFSKLVVLCEEYIRMVGAQSAVTDVYIFHWKLFKTFKGHLRYFENLFGVEKPSISPIIQDSISKTLWKGSKLTRSAYKWRPQCSCSMHGQSVFSLRAGFCLNQGPSGKLWLESRSADFWDQWRAGVLVWCNLGGRGGAQTQHRSAAATRRGAQHRRPATLRYVRQASTLSRQKLVFYLQALGPQSRTLVKACPLPVRKSMNCRYFRQL